MFCFSVRRLFITFSSPVNNYGITLQTYAETHIGFHAKWSLIFSDLNKSSKVSLFLLANFYKLDISENNFSYS